MVRRVTVRPVTDELFDIAGDDSVVLRLHVQPGAGRTAIVGRHGDALKVRVAAPPEGGRANEACRALVASTFGVKDSDVELTSGESSRTKRVTIRGVDPTLVARRLEDAIAAGGNAGPTTNVRQPGR